MSGGSKSHQPCILILVRNSSPLAFLQSFSSILEPLSPEALHTSIRSTEKVGHVVADTGP